MPPRVTRHRPLSSATRRAVSFAVLLAPVAALAHPGHGEGGFWPGCLHAVHGIDPVLAVIAVIAWTTQVCFHALWALPLAFVAAMAAGGALGAAGVHVPMVEP